MVPKRVPNEWDSDEPESSKRQLSELIGGDVTFEKLQSIFEPVFRKTVREVVDKFLHASSPSQSCDETKRDWMLRFVNQPPQELFTGNKVEDKDGGVLQVEIVDIYNKTVVLAGPISSLKVEFVVLPGDFDVDQQMDLGTKYFDSCVVPPREGKKPLIVGEVRTFLKNGVCLISNVCFTDNSRWTKSGKFRLGVQVMQGSKGYRVREAVSEAFKVKDRRGEACMKHSCPSLTDEVWRLKMIGRNGIFHQRLKSIGVRTVGDFRQMLQANPSILKETLKCGNSNIWKTIVEHAISHTKEQYKANQISPKVFCSINHSVADGVPRTYPYNFQLQQVADDLEGCIFNNATNEIPFNVAPTCPSVDVQSEPFTHPSLPLPCLQIQNINTGQQGHVFLPFMPSSSNYNGMDNRMEDNSFQRAAVSELHQSQGTQMTDEEFSHWFMNDQSEMLDQATDHRNPVNPFIQTETPNWYPGPPLLWRQLSANFSAAINESNMVLFSSLVPNTATPRTAWCKLRAAVILKILIKHMRVIRAKKAM